MTFDTDNLRQQIPYYLTAEDRRVLVDELKAISQGEMAEYILSTYNDAFGDDMLQGDGWRRFILFSFDTGERRSVQGLVLSNSCDVDPDNPRDAPARVIFAPLVRLEAYVNLLRQTDIDGTRIEAKVADIRAQKTTNIFYLPAGNFLSEDYVVRFDEVHSMPSVVHAESGDRQKLFTLSNAGFYMLVLKLSVHFCRLQENINRKPDPVTAA